MNALLIFGIVCGVLLAVFLLLLLVWAVGSIWRFTPMWVESRAAGVPMSYFQMFLLEFQRLDRGEIFQTLKVLRKAGVTVSGGELADHVLAGGTLQSVQRAAIAVDKAGLNIGFSEISRLALAGRDVAKAVEQHVLPIVLQVPQRGRESNAHGLVSVAKDGIALAVRARITVRTRLDRLIGGAMEDTIVARVGEGIVATIGRANSHREIVEDPGVITRAILERGLDRGTCFEILSLDIEDVSIVDNVAARLKSLQAETDKRIAQARAEERRAGAVANAQEMTARTTGMHAQVVAAQASLPNAVASAFRRRDAGRSRPLRPLVDAHDKWK